MTSTSVVSANKPDEKANSQKLSALSSNDISGPPVDQPGSLASSLAAELSAIEAIKKYSANERFVAAFKLLISGKSNQKAREVYGRWVVFGQGVLDWVTIFCCYLASFFTYTEVLSRWSPLNFFEHLSLAAGAATLYILILDRVGLYKRESSLLNIKEMRAIFHTGLYAAAAIFTIFFYLRFTSLSRITLTMAVVLSPVVLFLQRQFIYRWHVKLHHSGWAPKRALIYGCGRIGTQLAKRLYQSPSVGLLPVGFLDDEILKHGQICNFAHIGPKAGVPILGGEEWIVQAKKNGIELILIALPSASFDRNQRLVELCIEHGIDYAIVPNSYEKFIQFIEPFEVGGVPMLRRKEVRISPYYLFAKRVFDFVLAFVLVALLSPLLILFGLLICSESKGPIIFKQKRVGLRGREFSFYKFRSMYTDAPKYARTPSDPADPRITKMGRWLRRTSLDELPQLFNVLRGDMSLVGPRPEMPFIVANYTPLERTRLAVKPGITGVWQISSARAEPIHHNIEYDLFYIQNCSLLLDIAVIIKTGLSVIKGIGAY